MADNSDDNFDAAMATASLLKWLLTDAPAVPTETLLIRAYCSECRALGLPIDRIFFGVNVLHSLVATRTWKFEVEKDTVTENSFTRQEYVTYIRQVIENAVDEKDRGPFYHFIIGEASVQLKITDEHLPNDCSWMTEEGYTELYGLPAKQKDVRQWLQNEAMGTEMTGGFTWSTKRDGGFTEGHRQVLRDTRDALAVITQLLLTRCNSLSLLQIYLGADAGSRVFDGDIERGEGLTVRSAIWFSDVRGFTKLSGEIERTEMIEILNEVFDVTHQVITKHSGEVLKFMGDGCMAIFTSEETGFRRTSSFQSLNNESIDAQQGETVCLNARKAAAELGIELEKLRKERESNSKRAVSVGVGLNYGDVNYGNIGAAERLDFTVLGSAVNLASRTEGLCSKLGANVLATGNFVALDGNPEAWKNRGEHVVKGVEDPVAIYELTETPYK